MSAPVWIELHLAAYNADVERVCELLAAGGDPNEYDPDRAS
jgi:hypothetical protein